MGIRLREFAERAARLQVEPLSNKALNAIASAQTASVVRRMAEGRDTDGAPLTPNAPSWAKRKARQGRSTRPWQYTGASRRAVTVQVQGLTLIQTIGTPYSGIVHDGGTFTVRARQGGRSERQQKAVQTRMQAHEKRLMAAQGDHRRYSAARGAAARTRHEAERKGLAAFRRMTGVYQMSGAHRYGVMMGLRAGRLMAAFNLRARPKKTEWQVTLPPRRVLGVSRSDAETVFSIWKRDIAGRLAGRE